MPLSLSELGRRERQIMDILVRRGRATAGEVLEDLADQPSYSAVRSMLKLLQDKGYVQREWDGPRYVYRPAADLDELKDTAVRHFRQTFFNDSTEMAVVALLGASDRSLSDAELDRLADLIEEARRRGGRL
jgi:BlaI family transcriptional regulator, penicillinase repressor